MNITLYPQDFEQGNIASSGNTDSTTRLRSIDFIVLDETSNPDKITLSVVSTSSNEISLDLIGYSSDDLINPVFDLYWYDSPYTFDISSYHNVKQVRIVLKNSDDSDINVNDIESVNLISECTWFIDADGLPTNIKFIDIPEEAMTKPYPKSVWRITPNINDGLPYNDLLPDITLLENNIFGYYNGHPINKIFYNGKTITKIYYNK